MPLSKNVPSGQVRVVKKKKVSLRDEVRRIQELRKDLLHQLPQIFAAAASEPPPPPPPHLCTDFESSIIKVEYIDLVEEGDNGVVGDNDRVGGVDPAHIAPTTSALLLLLATTAMGCLLGFATSFIHTLVLRHPGFHPEPGLGADSFVLGRGGFILVRLLVMYILMYRNHLRLVAMLLFYEVIEEAVVMFRSGGSAGQVDVLVSASSIGFRLVLGLLFFCHGSRIRGMEEM